MEAVDISAKGQFRSSKGLQASSPDQLVLDRLEHRFHHRVVVAITPAVHRRLLNRKQPHKMTTLMGLSLR